MRKRESQKESAVGENVYTECVALVRENVCTKYLSMSTPDIYTEDLPRMCIQNVCREGLSG